MSYYNGNDIWNKCVLSSRLNKLDITSLDIKQAIHHWNKSFSGSSGFLSTE